MQSFIFNPILSRTAGINDHGLDVQHPDVLLELCAWLPSFLGTYQTSGCLDFIIIHNQVQGLTNLTLRGQRAAQKRT